MAGVWKAIRFSKKVQLQMGQINFSLSSNREKKYMSHGAAVFTDGSTMDFNIWTNSVSIEHKLIQG